MCVVVSVHTCVVACVRTWDMRVVVCVHGYVCAYMRGCLCASMHICIRAWVAYVCDCMCAYALGYFKTCMIEYVHDCLGTYVRDRVCIRTQPRTHMIVCVHTYVVE
jgi:hypothetical protein